MEKNKLITEEQIEQQKLNSIKNHVNELQQKEEFLVNTPYYDETPRLAMSKILSCKALAGRIFYATCLISIPLCLPVSQAMYRKKHY